MATKYEFYTPTPDGQVYIGENWVGQTFTVGNVGTDVDHIVTSVKITLFLRNSGETPGNVTVSIRATASDLPTGSDLASGTTNGSTLTDDTDGEVREITFSTGALLRASTKYAIIVRLATPNADNKVAWKRLSLGGGTNYGGGNTVTSDDGNTWNTATPDQNFEEWGDPQGSGEGGAIYPINTLLRASGIRRTFWAGLGGQAVYQCELVLGGMTTSYVPPISSREPQSAVPPAIFRKPPITETGIPGVTMPFTTTTPMAPQMAEYAGMGQTEYDRIIRQGKITEALREFGPLTGPGDLARFKARYPGLL